MPTVTITIPDPVLVSGQYFKVEYRLSGTTTWTLIGNRNNAAFSISLPDAGAYELRTTLYNGTEFCNPVISTFSAITDYDCGDFTASIVVVNGLYYVRIVYSLPSPYIYPPCGFIVEITQGATVKTVPYPNGLPSVSGTIDIALPANVNTILNVYMNLCGGKKKLCFGEGLLPASVSCTPYTSISASMIKNNGYNLVINYTQSNPLTPFINVTYKQVGYVAPASGLLDSGSYNAPITPISGSTSFTAKVFPNTAVEPYQVQYEGTLIDICGNSHYFITAPISF